MTDEALQEKIKSGLAQLSASINENETRVSEIIGLFTTEIPSHVQQLKYLIDRHDWLTAAVLLHKMRPHFGYLCLDEIVNQLSEWENELRTEPMISITKQQRRLSEFQNLTENIVIILGATPYSPRVEADALPDLPLTGRLVLIAEDDEINALVFELFVKELGGDVIKVVDGYKAVEIASTKKPDMIFMDIHMPLFNGLNAIRELRSKGITCPIVSCSASTHPSERQNSLDAGADDFLIKPANRASINGQLLKYLVNDKVHKDY